MSLHTTLARGEVRARERIWKEHQGGCVGCAGSKVRQPCADGLVLKAELADARAALRQEQAAGKAPIEGQGELFGAGEL